MPTVTLTEAPDVYTTTWRSPEDVIFLNVYMLGGDDQFSNLGWGSLRIYMGAGNDYAKINHCWQAIVYGEGGNDTVDANLNSPFTFYGGDGADRVNFLKSSYWVSIDGGPGNDGFYGNSFSIGGSINGGGGNDLFKGFGNLGGYTPTLAGGTGDDTYYVGSAAPPNILELAGEGFDTVRSSISYTLAAELDRLDLQGSGNINGTGNGVANVIKGNGGNNSLSGLVGNDKLYGGAGSDVADGGEGVDWLEGGSGRDEFTGGLGGDRFVFREGDFGGATIASADVIHDFVHAQGDKIRLDLIDANSTADGNQAFAFLGTGAFTQVAGQLRYEQAGGNTFVQGDIDGNGVADFVIQLDGIINLIGTDFIL